MNNIGFLNLDISKIDNFSRKNLQEEFLESLKNKIEDFFQKNKGQLKNKSPIKELYFISFLIYFLNESAENLSFDYLNFLSENIEDEEFYKLEITKYVK